MSETGDTPTPEPDDESFDPTDLYRTDPAATFKGHLFVGDDVRSAGVENGDKADHPVPTLCSRRTDYGPFARITEAAILDHADADTEDDDRDLCARCVNMAADRLQAEPDPADAPFEPSEFTVTELRSELDDDGYSGDDLEALRAAEAAGKHRKTALGEIDKRLGGGES